MSESGNVNTRTQRLILVWFGSVRFGSASFQIRDFGHVVILMGFNFRVSASIKFDINRMKSANPVFVAKENSRDSTGSRSHTLFKLVCFLFV